MLIQIIAMGEKGSTYTQFKKKGMFIGAYAHFSDCFGGISHGDRESARSVAENMNCWIKFYRVHIDKVDYFCGTYGRFDEPPEDK